MIIKTYHINGTIKDYKIITKIGNGPSGEIFKCEKDSQKFAIKKILLKDICLDLFRQELYQIKNLQHPNIIKIYDEFQDSNFFYIVMEYVENGNLTNYIQEKKINFETNSNIIQKFIYQLVNVLCYLQ